MSLLAQSARLAFTLLAFTIAVHTAFAFSEEDDPLALSDPELVALASTYRLALVGGSQPTSVDDITQARLPIRADGLAFATTRRPLGLVIDPYSSRVLRVIAWNGPPAERFALADLGGRVFVLDRHGGVWLLDIERGDVLWEIPPSDDHPATAFAASRDGELVALADTDGTVRVFDGDGTLANPSSMSSWPAASWRSVGVAHSPRLSLVVLSDGERLAVGGLSGPDLIMSLGSLIGSPSPRPLDPNWGQASSFVFSPSLRTLAFLRGGSLYLLDIAARKLVARPAPGILKIESLSDTGEMHAVSTQGGFSMLTFGPDGVLQESVLSPPPFPPITPTDASLSVGRVALVKDGRLTLRLPAGAFSQVVVVSSQTGRVVATVPVTQDLMASSEHVADVLATRLRLRLDSISPALDRDRVAQARLDALRDLWFRQAEQLFLSDFRLVGSDPPTATRGLVLHLYSPALRLAAVVALPSSDLDTRLATDLASLLGASLQVRVPGPSAGGSSPPGRGFSLLGRRASIRLPAPISWTWSVPLAELCSAGRCPLKWADLYLPSGASPFPHPLGELVSP